MTFSTEPSQLTETKPFVVEHQKHDLQPSGQFVPGARLLVTAILRTSGLLAELPDAEARTLLLLLTFLSPNGHVQASVPELAQALHISMDKARRRLERLAEMQWAGEPLAHGRTSESGLEIWSLSPALVEVREVPILEAPAPLYKAASREAVIAFSRSHYTVPRAEAERLVAAQYGQDPEEAGEGPEAVARRHLSALGVSRDQVAELLASHALEDVQNQLDWLKHRGAKSPGRFVVAAIQGQYEAPARVRLERAIAEEDVAPQSLADGVVLDIPQAVGQTEQGSDTEGAAGQPIEKQAMEEQQ